MTSALAHTVRDAEAATGISRDVILRAIRSTVTSETGIPPLPAKKVGTKYLILATDLTEWLQSLPDA